MHITSATYRDFRNVEGTFEPCEGVNVLFGPNGQGKTNALEGIYVSCYGRSFRPGKQVDMLRFGAAAARVELTVEGDGVESRISLTLAEGERRHGLEGKEGCSLLEIANHLRVIFFGPEDLSLVKGSKSVRRDFLDRAIAFQEPSHGKLLREYQKLLRERNHLLRDFSTGRAPPGGLIESFEEQLARRGAALLDARIGYLEEFLPLAVMRVSEHTAARLELDGGYDSSIELPEAEGRREELEKRLLSELATRRRADMPAARTSVGPHLDDLALRLNGKEARFFASQGEQRQVAVALKLAQLQLWRQKFGINPVLLLDDVASELDDQRAELLFSVISGWGIQTLISTTSKPDMVLEGDVRFFEVDSGTIKQPFNAAGRSG